MKKNKLKLIFAICLVTALMSSLLLPTVSAQDVPAGYANTFTPTSGSYTTSIKTQFFYYTLPVLSQSSHGYSLQLNSLTPYIDGVHYWWQNCLIVVSEWDQVYWHIEEYYGTGLNLVQKGYYLYPLPSDVSNTIMDSFNGAGTDCIELGFGSGGIGGQTHGTWINIFHNNDIIWKGMFDNTNATAYPNGWWGDSPENVPLLDTQPMVVGDWDFHIATFTSASFGLTTIAPVSLSCTQTQIVTGELSNLKETAYTGQPMSSIYFDEHL